jgi:hypothetical protein
MTKILPLLLFVTPLFLVQACSDPDFAPPALTEAQNPGASSGSTLAAGNEPSAQALAEMSGFLPDTPQQRQALVERYFKAVSFGDFQREMVEQMSISIPPEHQAQFLDTMSNKVRWDSIETAAKESLARHMTVSELSAFLAFVEKPEGKSALSKMRFYMADLNPVVQQEVFRAVAQ